MVEKRPTLTLKPFIDVLSSDDDMRVDLYTFDLLLPCRRYEINYKIALLGNISPTLEFLLRLVRTVDGLEEDEARTFFGFSRTEMEYVISEATTPGYVDRIESRLWLTVAGDALFSEGGSQPAIFNVESRSKQFGFDQLSLSPEYRSIVSRCYSQTCLLTAPSGEELRPRSLGSVSDSFSGSWVTGKSGDQNEETSIRSTA